MPDETATTWETSREEFIAHWGALGSNWGINRTMAQIHALLMTAPEPMHTEEMMERLHISRGNANTNIRELIGWGLIRLVVKKGERRELDPALAVLRKCSEETKGEAAGPGKDFHRQMKELQEFVEFGMKVSDTVASMKHASALQWAMRLLS